MFLFSLMLTIRLSRAGRKHIPFFRIVLTDHRQSAKHGYLKVLGSWNALSKELHFDRAEAEKYVSCGAKYSESLAKIVSTAK